MRRWFSRASIGAFDIHSLVSAASHPPNTPNTQPRSHPTHAHSPAAHDRGKQHAGASPLRLHLLYRDVSGQPVARWEALPIDPDTWRAAAASTQERWLPLYTTAKVTPSPSPSPTKSRSPTPVGPAMRRGSIGGSSTSGRASGGSPSKPQQQQKHAYVGDLLVNVRLVPNRRAPRLRYRRPFRVAGGVLQLPSQLLLPQWLRASLVGSISWYVDGLLAAFAALRRRGPAGGLKGSSGQLEGEDGEDEENMAGVPRLNLFQKLFYLLALFVALASVSVGASLALVVAASLFPVVTFLVAGSLRAVVGLGLPALVVVGFVFSAPPVRRGLLEPAILRFRWTRALFLEDAAGEEEDGPEEIGVEEQQEPAGTPVAEKPAA